MPKVQKRLQAPAFACSQQSIQLHFAGGKCLREFLKTPPLHIEIQRQPPMRPDSNEFPPIFFTGELTFYGAIKIIATDAPTWQKITDSNKLHFCGNWTAQTLLELAVRYLCQCDEWSSRRDGSIPAEVLDEMRGIIFQIARYGTPMLSHFCLMYCTGTADNGEGEYLELLTATAQRCFGDKNLSASEAVTEVKRNHYYTVAKSELNLLQKEAQKPNRIDATWLVTLVGLFDRLIHEYNELGLGNRILIATPDRIYVDHMDYLIDEATALKHDAIRSIFSHWEEADVDYHIQIYAALACSIKQARDLASTRNLHQELLIIHGLIDWFRLHLKKAPHKLNSSTYSNLRNTLGIIFGEIIPLDQTRSAPVTHEATIRQCIDARNARIDIDLF